MKILLPFVLVLLAGCAAPIHSRFYQPGEPVEGFVYKLTKADVSIAVPIRLKGCKPFTVVLMPPLLTAKPVADDGAAYVVDPSDSLNLFKSVSGVEVKLTEDGRLSKAAAQSKDTTLPILGEVLKGAGLVPMTVKAPSGVRPEDDQPSSRQPAFSCDADSAADVARLESLEGARLQLRDEASRHALGVRLKDDDDGAMKAYSSALAEMDAHIAEVEKRLTRAATLRFKFGKERKEVSALVYANVIADWAGTPPACAAPAAGKSSPAYCETLSQPCPKRKPESGKVPDWCVPLHARLSPSGLVVKTPDFSTESVPGLLYRLPDGSNARAYAEMQDSSLLAVKVAKPLPADDGQAETHIKLFDDFVGVPQWGPMGLLKTNASFLSSSGIDVEFDAWAVPKTVKWSAEAGGFAGLLGLYNQVEAAKTKPAVDPTVELKGQLYQRMLNECLSATSSSLPPYCASIVK